MVDPMTTSKSELRPPAGERSSSSSSSSAFAAVPSTSASAPAAGIPPASGPWLAIDTATDTAGVAICDASRQLASAHWTRRRRHTVELGPTVERLLKLQNLEPAALAGIAVAIGPGSYTGLRIGLSFAKGLAIGIDPAPLLLGVPTLDILAAALSPPHVPRDLPLWAVLQAGRGRVVAAVYPSIALPEVGPRPLAWPDPRALEVCTVAELRDRIEGPAWVAGELDAAARAMLERPGIELLPPAASLRQAGWLAELGRRGIVDVVSAGPDVLAPIYLGPQA
jgi:tRNA threonylcarbamoyladenosine biosynthesis protein TsaB